MKILLWLLDFAPRLGAATGGFAGLVLGLASTWWALAGLNGGWHVSNVLLAALILIVLTPLGVLIAAFINYGLAGILLSPFRWIVSRVHSA